MRVVIIFLLALIAPALFAGEAWKSLGPWGGSVKEDYWNISEDGNVIVVPGERHVFVSRNQGVTWTLEAVDLPLGDTMDRLQLVNVKGEHVLVTSTGLGNELLVSNNLGKTWERISIPDICLLNISGAPSVLARGGNVLELIVMERDGTCRTLDGGANWNTAGMRIYSVSPGALFSHPDRPDIIYSKGRAGGIDVYTDYGTKWVASTYESSFTVDPFNPARLLAVDLHGRVSQSLDYGMSYEQVVQMEEPDSLFVTWGIVFDPVVEDRVYVYGSKDYLHVSDDGGKTWELQPFSAEEVKYGRVNEMRFLPGVRNKALIATETRGFGLLDMDTWQVRSLNHGFSNFRVTALGHFDQGKLEMVAGTYEGDVFQYDDETLTWTRELDLFEYIQDVVIDWAGTGNILVAGSGTLHWKNPSNGEWKLQAQGVWAYPHIWSCSFQADPNVPGRYIGSVDNVIFESLDYGATGEVIINGPPSTMGNIFFFDSDPQRIVVTGVGGGGLSVDGGATWDSAAVPGMERHQGAHQSRIDERRLWVPAADGYFESRDGGTSWTHRLEIEEATSKFEIAERAAHQNEHSMFVDRMFTNPGNDDHLFLLGGRIGYAESLDDGNTWTLVPLAYRIRNYSMKEGGNRPEDAYIGTSAGVLSHETVVALELSVASKETDTGLELDLKIDNSGANVAHDVQILWSAYADGPLEQNSNCVDAHVVQDMTRCRIGDLAAGESRTLSVKLNAGQDSAIAFHSGVISRDAVSDFDAASVSVTKAVPEPEPEPEPDSGSEPEPEPQPDTGGESGGGGLLNPIWLLMCLIVVTSRLRRRVI